MKQHTDPVFFLIGNFGNKNIGDQIMLYGILKQMDMLFPAATFRVLSKEPEYILHKTYGSRITFVQPKLAQIIQNLWLSSFIVLAGGTHLEDDGTFVWRFYRNLIRMLLFSLVTKILQKPFYHLGVGVGPLSRKTSRLIVGYIGELSTLICVRDPDSYNLLKEIGLESKTVQGFDPSILLAQNKCEAHPIRRESSTVLGLSLLPYFTIYYNSTKTDVKLVIQYAEAISSWLDRNDTARVYLFAFNGDERYDPVMIDRLEDALLAINPSREQLIRKINYVADPEEMLRQVAQCTHFVSFRYHSALFAYLCNLPCLIVNYQAKCLSFAKQVGLPTGAIITPEEILAGELAAKFADLEAHPINFEATLSLTDAKSLCEEAINETFLS